MKLSRLSFLGIFFFGWIMGCIFIGTFLRTYSDDDDKGILSKFSTVCKTTASGSYERTF
jgi:hypothetical protein